MRSNRPSSLCGIAGFLALAFLLSWATSADSGTSTFEYPSDPEHLVISYTQVHDLIRNADPTPLLRIYGDGRALVHYPIYMQKAGDYEFLLTRGEIQSLLSSLEDLGLFAFDLEDAKARREGAEARRRAATGQFFELSDSSHTVIEIRLSSYSTATKSFTDFEKSLTWANVAQEARLYPEMTELARMAKAEAQLRELLERTDLLEVP